MKLRITPMGVFKILFLLANLICLLNVFQVKAMVTVLYTMIFPFVILLFVISLSKGRRKNDVVFLLLTVVAALSAVSISLLLTKNSVGIADLKKFVIFVTTLAMFFAANRLKIDRSTIKFIEISTTVTSVFLVLVYFVNNSNIYMYNLLGMKFLTFHFDNPNFVAIYLFVYAVYNSIMAESKNKIIFKILHVVLALFMFYFVFQTLSRNALITAAVFLVVFIIFKFFKKIPLSYNVGVSIVISAWPIIFLVIYNFIIRIINDIGILSLLTESGKELDTRSDVWSTAIAEIQKYPLTGNYGASIIRQSHNTHLDIWVSYGLIALIGTIILIAYIIYNNGRTYSNRISHLYMLGFISCIVMGMAEAALFAGCQGLFVLIGAFILLSKADESMGEINLQIPSLE